MDILIPFILLLFFFAVTWFPVGLAVVYIWDLLLKTIFRAYKVDGDFRKANLYYGWISLLLLFLSPLYDLIVVVLQRISLVVWFGQAIKVFITHYIRVFEVLAGIKEEKQSENN